MATDRRPDEPVMPAAGILVGDYYLCQVDRGSILLRNVKTRHAHYVTTKEVYLLLQNLFERHESNPSGADVQQTK